MMTNTTSLYASAKRSSLSLAVISCILGMSACYSEFEGDAADGTGSEGEFGTTSPTDGGGNEPVEIWGIEPPPPTPLFDTPVEGYAAEPSNVPVATDPYRQGVWDFDRMLLAQYPTTSPGAIWADHGHSANSDHYTGRAFDWMMNKTGTDASAVERARGDSLVSWLLETVDGEPHMRLRRLGIKYIVWYNRIWSTTYKEWREHRSCESGGNTDCHRNHIHFSFGEPGADGHTSWWGAPPPPPTTPPPGEDTGGDSGGDQPPPPPPPSLPSATPQLTAFVASGTGRLAIYDPGAGQSIATDLGVLAGTSPSITRMRDGTYRVAFVGDGTADLHIYDGATLDHTNQGVQPGTSPSISDMADGSYKVAFVGYGTADLHIFDGTNTTNTVQGVHPGTSPSITGLSNGGYQIAFVGYNTPYVYLHGADNGQTDQGIRPETSPSITGFRNGGYTYAFVGLGTDLLTLHGAVNIVTDQGVQPGTSPSIAAQDDGGYEVAFKALGTDFLYYHGTALNITTNQGIQTGTSPSILRNFSF